MARAVEDPEGVRDLVFGAGEGTPSMLDTDMMAKAMAVVKGPRVEWEGRCLGPEGREGVICRRVEDCYMESYSGEVGGFYGQQEDGGGEGGGCWGLV